jgi:hypothetical protein
VAYYVTAVLLDPDHGNKAVIGGPTIQETEPRNRNWMKFKTETEAKSFVTRVRDSGQWPF